MKVYIVREGRSVQIYLVIPKWKTAFLAANRRRILGWGKSLPEAIERLGGVSEKLAVLNELSKQ
ncbi:MAG TPA: hypothetical protein VMH27_08695 [Puia sp.]|nr:hypothetical protein [Puia sp.]